MPAICRARLLSDLTGQTPCDKEATSLDGRLCAFHSRQCQGLYRGYKRRNAELDKLSEKPPAFLATSRTSLVTQDFGGVEHETTLRELHEYLFRKYILLERVIRARKLHHSHFFAIDHDYGHEKYLTKLQNDKHVMARALERLGKRGAEVMYKNKEWLDWVKKCQEEEETQRENESKKVKLESLLFKRHQKEIERHQREIKSRENQLREGEFLQKVYEQRLSEMSEDEQDEWDPVQDLFGGERANYVDLIKFFLMLKDQDTSEANASDSGLPVSNGTTETEHQEKSLSKSAKKRAKKANSAMKKLADPSQQAADGRGPNTIEMETRAQMRERLQKPVKYERPKGWYIDTENGPIGVQSQTHPLPDDEIDQLLQEVAEVKNFLFCRLLLSHASLLPFALQANSIEDFLANENVTQEHLRDLCLKIERPRLQDVRDACADFIRGENEDVEGEELDKRSEEEGEKPRTKLIPKKYALEFKSRKSIPEKYQTKREKAAKKERTTPQQLLGEDERDGVVDFGEVTDEKDYRRKQMRIKICGRYMYNYPSEKALGRAGWYHFSVIAKDSSLFDAVELCRNWTEFFELNILCLYHYFPAPKWTLFTGDILRQQLLQLGFIPYFACDKADKFTHYFQTGSRGMARRSHEVFEMRNFICAHIKRDDEISRRFIQYLSMETWELRALIRDRKTGRVLIQPPEDELWLVREKSGWGRALKNDFETVAEVGPEFFEKMDDIRQWHFSFEEYYDVYIWDSNPGRSYHILQRKIEETLTRAMRVKELKDMFSVCAPVLKTVTRDEETGRVRTVKAGEESIWDTLSSTARAWKWSPDTGDQDEGFDESYAYTEADELEDAILFPEEESGELKDNLFRANPSIMEMFEKRPALDMRRFAEDLSSDEELSDEEPDGESHDEALDETLNDALAQALEGAPYDDGDPEWDTENSSDMDSASYDDHEFVTAEEADMDDALEALDKRFKTMTIANTRDPDYFLPILRDPSSAEMIPQSVRDNPADLMAALRLSMKRQKVYNNSHDALEADFFRHIDREKSKVFKNCWRMGDLSPNAIKRQIEWYVMVGFMDDFIMEEGLKTGPFELCKFMRMASHFTDERRIVDDAFKACAAVALFFDTEAFLGTERGELFKNSKLLDQAERAKEVPDRRTHMSNKTMPKEFWADWDRLLKDNKRASGDVVDDIYPMEWRKAIRPVIVRLFKAGVIAQSYCGSAAGIATANAEPDRPMDLYIDYRISIPLARVVSHLRDPTPLDRTYILTKARRFRDQQPNARFSALRMWSAPHFYPLMLGIDKRPMCSFLDDRGRAWEFKFIPKDMPYSEWSVHQQLSLRIEPYRDIFGDQVMVAKDLVLVMGKDERDVRRLSEGVTWAIQTKPWRLEVDFWRSFVNVDVQFLERLHEKWLE